MKRLKEKWGITSNFQLFIICIVFAITGSFSVLITKPVILFIFGDLDGLNPLLSWLLRILILFPIYQVLLLFFGFIFFQSNAPFIKISACNFAIFAYLYKQK